MPELGLPQIAIIWTASIIASFIFILSWLAIFRQVINKLNEKTSSAPNRDEVENKIWIYFICTSFWPAALVMGNHFLKKPETAQTGRTCIIIFMWFSTFIVAVSVATLLVSVTYLPEIIRFIKDYGASLN